MTSDNYFDKLYACLNKLPIGEREEAVSFYKEYAEEGNLTEYQQIEERFGTPQSLAAQIYADSATKCVTHQTGEKNHIWKGFSLAVIGICTLPFSFPALMIALSIGIAALVSILAIVFSMGVTLVALGGTGIALFVKSFSFLVPFAPILWLKTLGGALILISIALLIIILLFFAAKFIIKFITVGISKTIRKEKRK